MENASDVGPAPGMDARAAAALALARRPAPRWYPPLAGLLAAAFCLFRAIPHDNPLRGPAQVTIIASEIALLAWCGRYRGTFWPADTPVEIRRVRMALVVGVFAAIAIVLLALRAAPAWVAAIVALAVVTPAVTWYERAYVAAAVRARARLG